MFVFILRAHNCTETSCYCRDTYAPRRPGFSFRNAHSTEQRLGQVGKSHLKELDQVVPFQFRWMWGH